MKVIIDVCVERANQDRKWGGPAHDDKHSPDEWLYFIRDKLEKAEELIGNTDIQDGDVQYRRRLVQIASLAIAAAESLDRHTERMT